MHGPASANPHQHGAHQHGAHQHGAHGAHGPAGGPGRFGAAFAIGAALNAGLVAAQFGFGLMAHSAALLADAVHNLGDVLALLLAWGAAWLGTWLPSSRRTYGYGRASILAALVNAVVLLVGVGAIGVEALRRLGHPGPVGGLAVMLVAGAGIAVNGGTAWLFSRGQGDLNVRAAFQHMAADAAVSAGVVATGAVVLATGWTWLDPLASLGIVAVIVAGTWGTLTHAVAMAMDAVPEGVEAGRVQAYLRALPGVQEVHDLHIWALSTTQTALTAHLVRAAGCETAPESLAERACRDLAEQFGIGHATLQLESESTALSCPLRAAETV